MYNLMSFDKLITTNHPHYYSIEHSHQQQQLSLLVLTLPLPALAHYRSAVTVVLSFLGFHINKAKKEGVFWTWLLSRSVHQPSTPLSIHQLTDIWIFQCGASD